MEVNEDLIYKQTIERCRFFQTVHNWPLSEELDYEGWLRNFDKGEDRTIACFILNFFEYYSTKIVDQLLRKSVGDAGYILSKKTSNWSHKDFKKKCIFSYVPGENPSPTDSGNFFSRKLRDELNIPEEQIIDFFKIGERLKADSYKNPIILVDDFVGSGAQIDKAWNKNEMPGLECSLGELYKEKQVDIIYAPLIVNYRGANRIQSKCPNLILSCCHILGLEYNLFNPSCYCWKNDLELFKKGTDLIERISREIGIPSNNGNNTHDIRGFDNQGLAFSFSHGAPDAVIPIFYWESNGWTRLFKKFYVR